MSDSDKINNKRFNFSVITKLVKLKVKLTNLQSKT